MMEQIAEAAGSLLMVGVVQGAFGVRGVVRVRSFMADPASLIHYDTWWLQIPPGPRSPWHRKRIRHAQWHRHAVLASIEGLDDRDGAAQLSGCAVALERHLLPPLAEGEFYWSDLLGLVVENLQGQALGTVTRIIETGANDCLEVQSSSTGMVTMMPFLWERVVQSIDLETRRIVVDWEPEESAPSTLP